MLRVTTIISTPRYKALRDWDEMPEDIIPDDIRNLRNKIKQELDEVGLSNIKVRVLKWGFEPCDPVVTLNGVVPTAKIPAYWDKMKKYNGGEQGLSYDYSEDSEGLRLFTLGM